MLLYFMVAQRLLPGVTEPHDSSLISRCPDRVLFWPLIEEIHVYHIALLPGVSSATVAGRALVTHLPRTHSPSGLFIDIQALRGPLTPNLLHSLLSWICTGLYTAGTFILWPTWSLCPPLSYPSPAQDPENWWQLERKVPGLELCCLSQVSPAGT